MKKIANEEKMKRRKKKKINDSLENNIQWVEVPLPA
jgi:hypothetical protein